jgi:hypothetical protein
MSFVKFKCMSKGNGKKGRAVAKGMKKGDKE